jgi:dolichol-phosphate mannosyltransferase
MKTAIIIPTYNERSNIDRLVRRITAAYPHAQILIVDDNSPDGTGDIAEQISINNKNMHVIHQPKKNGLGTALKVGFQWALARDIDYIVQMDADFSHDPADILRILDVVKSGPGFVIGSRYKNGLRVVGRSLFRNGLSYLANYYARIILGLPIYDLTSGFRCIQSRVLKEIDLSRAFSEGYAFQIEMAYRCYQRGCFITELPIVFTERKKGKSKLSLLIIIEGLITVIRLRFFGT